MYVWLVSHSNSGVEFTHFSHSESTTLHEVWGLDDTAPAGQAAQEAFGLAVATAVVSTQTKTAGAVISTKFTAVVQDNCDWGREQYRQVID